MATMAVVMCSEPGCANPATLKLNPPMVKIVLGIERVRPVCGKCAHKLCA